MRYSSIVTAVLASHAISGFAMVAKIPVRIDTGVRSDQCYFPGVNGLGRCDDVASLPAQDGQLGRDATLATNQSGDGRLGFAFIRICNSGERAGTGGCPSLPVLGPNPNDWACIEDRLTGIMWEVKTETGFRARNRKFTNYSPEYDPVGQFRSSTDATGYVSRVNNSKLCGYSDWSLSHTAKVQTIVDYGVVTSGATRVDSGYFPTVNPDWYWNASPNPSSVSTAWAVNFGDGSVSNSAPRETLRYVQLMRNSKDTVPPDGRYAISPDGTEVHDRSGGAELIWQRCVEGMYWDGSACNGTPLALTHEESLRRAAERSAVTGLALRVPNVKEQNWLVQRVIFSPPIEHPTFPNTPAGPSWTSSPEVRRSSRAWAINFDVGQIETHARSERLALRLVRDEDPLAAR